MENQEKKSNKSLIAAIIVVTIIALGIIVYFLLQNNGIITTGGRASILKEKITAENYEELTEKVAQELKNTDDLYYFSYATMYHLMKDGMSSAFSGSEDEGAMYVNIYGRTAKDLIKEGKKLMEDNNITIDEFRKKLNNLENTTNTN